jgi:hypothetical protein
MASGMALDQLPLPLTGTHNGKLDEQLAANRRAKKARYLHNVEQRREDNKNHNRYK